MSRIYADIIVDISQEKLDKSFQYEIPEELQGQVEIGKRVRIPFGNGGRELTGYVIGLSEEPKIEPDRIKAILAVKTGAWKLNPASFPWQDGLPGSTALP